MNPLGIRARSEEFARLLDAASGGLIAGHPPLFAVAGQLRAFGASLQPVGTPRPEFRAALRTRLVAVAGVQAATVARPAASRTRGLESAVSWSQSRRGQRGIGLAAGAMASIVVVSGVAVAGSQSLPGDPFYPVKRGGEALELRAASGEVAKGSKHLQFAAARLAEVRALALGRDAAFSGPTDLAVAAASFGGSVGQRVRAALADMDRDTRTGSELLTAAYRETNRGSALQILSTFAGRQSRDLTALLPSLPASTRSSAEVSLALVSSVGAQASELLAIGVCSAACNPSQSAPELPPATGGPAPQPAPQASSATPCGCQPAAQPALTPEPSPTPEPTASQPGSPQPSPGPTSASPSPRQTSSPMPISTVIPTALPTLPVPLPTITPPALTSLLPAAVVPAVPLG